MDPFYFQTFLLIIYHLLQGCAAQAEWDQTCDPPPCVTNLNLACGNAFAGKKCECLAGFANVKGEPGCRPLGGYGDSCERNQPPCKSGFFCGKTPPLTCGCRLPSDNVYDGTNCIPRGEHGDRCATPPDTCKLLRGLACDSGKCECDTANAYTWNPVQNKCIKSLSVWNQPCRSDPFCEPGFNLTCEKNFCVCSPPDLVPHPAGNCGPRAQFGEPCDRELECETTWNLECQNTCVCVPNHVEAAGKRCSLPAKLGQACPLPVCDPNGFMTCTNNVCTCQTDLVEHPNGICGPPGLFGNPCGPPICKDKSGLVCDQQRCACSQPDFYPRRDQKTCGPRAKLYEFCILVECEQGPNWNLQCHPGYESCLCAGGTIELDDGLRCGPAGKVGDRCDRWACLKSHSLICGPSKTCECVAGSVEHPMKICGIPPRFGQPCGPLPKCRENSNLTCPPGPSSKCACSSPDLTHHQDLTCGPKAKLRENCDLPKCEDGPDWHLTCHLFKCACTPGYVEWAGLRCGPSGKLGDKCDLPICDPNGNLECNAAKTCVCTTGNVEHPMKTCAPPPLFGQPCGPLPKCKENSNLICPPGPSSKCACSSPDLTPYQDKTCGPKAKLREPCDLFICEDGPNWHLTCTNNKCACTPGNVEWDGLRCGPIGKLGDKCDLPICDKSLNLVCVPKKTCECVAGSVEHPMKTCGPAPLFGEPCGPLPKCKENSNLICPPGPSSVCACSSPDLTSYPDLTCGPKGKLREACDLFQCEDGPDWHLTCHLTNFKCVCTPGYVEWDGLRCGPIGKLGDKCDHPICDPNGNLECTATKTCVCTTGNVEHPMKTCAPPPLFGQPCGPPPKCKENSNLICPPGPSSKCACSSPDLTPYQDKTCGPKAKLREPCDLFICEDEPNWHLACTNNKCACTPGYVEWDGLRCGPTGKLGDKCDLPICDPNGNLECTATKTCVCTTGNVEHPRGVCGPPALLRGKCGPPICEPGRNLTCKSGHCACLKLYEDDHTGGCERTASNYGEPCHVDSECKQGQNMFCDLQSKTCDCLPHYDLDKVGETPCVFNRFNGRTYGQACDQTKQIRSCVVAHNLTCNGNTCVCIDDHIPDKSTEKDPAIGVTTCKLAAGTQGRGDPCVPNSNDITQKCDTLLDIVCNPVHKVCTCAPGFIPIAGRPHPCDGGRQKFDAACDPPEVIIPPRGIDPITGLPLPGPTSPPPPKYACDPTLKLVCVKGKCECPDQAISHRYALDPTSGRCLITGGYACVMNAECLSGKCVTKKEVTGGSGSHDHDEKICTGPIVGGRNRISGAPPTSLPAVFIVIAQLVQFVSILVRVT